MFLRTPTVLPLRTNLCFGETFPTNNPQIIPNESLKQDYSPEGITETPHDNYIPVLEPPPLHTISASRGKVAPDFNLNDHNGNSVNLYKALEKGPVVLFFFPSNKTPFCQQQIKTFRDYYPQFEKLNASVFGISADSEKSHQQFHEDQALPFSLLSDPNNTVRKEYGAQYLLGLPKRMTFVIAPGHSTMQPSIQKSFSSQTDIETHLQVALNCLKSLV
jgi:peroxiredoxin Q/BCP